MDMFIFLENKVMNSAFKKFLLFVLCLFTAVYCSIVYGGGTIFHTMMKKKEESYLYKQKILKFHEEWKAHENTSYKEILEAITTMGSSLKESSLDNLYKKSLQQALDSNEQATKKYYLEFKNYFSQVPAFSRQAIDVFRYSLEIVLRLLFEIDAADAAQKQYAQNDVPRVEDLPNYNQMVAKMRNDYNNLVVDKIAVLDTRRFYTELYVLKLSFLSLKKSDQIPAAALLSTMLPERLIQYIANQEVEPLIEDMKKVVLKQFRKLEIKGELLCEMKENIILNSVFYDTEKDTSNWDHKIIMQLLDSLNSLNSRRQLYTLLLLATGNFEVTFLDQDVEQEVMDYIKKTNLDGNKNDKSLDTLPLFHDIPDIGSTQQNFHWKPKPKPNFINNRNYSANFNCCS